MIRTVCIGQSSYDIHIKIDGYPVEDSKQRFVNKIACGGGAASNVAYLLSKWGQPAVFAGVVGNDVFGNRIRKELESVGVDTRYVETSFEKDTVLSFIIINSLKSTRTLFNVADEYVKLKKYDFDFTPDVLFIDGHDPYASKQTLDRFPKAISVLQAERYNQDIVNLANRVNYLICSIDFAASVAKIKPDFKNINTLAEIYNDVKKKFERQKVVITLGINGTMYMIDNQIKISPALKVNTADTSAALDVFSGAFTYAVGNNFNLEKAIKYGNIAAALSIQNIGRRNNIPKLDEVSKIYEKNN